MNLLEEKWYINQGAGVDDLPVGEKPNWVFSERLIFSGQTIIARVASHADIQPGIEIGFGKLKKEEMELVALAISKIPDMLRILRRFELMGEWETCPFCSAGEGDEHIPDCVCLELAEILNPIARLENHDG